MSIILESVSDDSKLESSCLSTYVVWFSVETKTMRSNLVGLFLILVVVFGGFSSVSASLPAASEY